MRSGRAGCFQGYRRHEIIHRAIVIAAVFASSSVYAQYTDGIIKIGVLDDVCDTQAQVERFAAVFAGDAQDAIRIVNAEQQDPSACVVKDIAYMRGSQLGMVRHGDSAFEIVRILVIGIETENGILPVRPSVYFSLFSVKEYGI